MTPQQSHQLIEQSNLRIAELKNAFSAATDPSDFVREFVGHWRTLRRTQMSSLTFTRTVFEEFIELTYHYCQFFGARKRAGFPPSAWLPTFDAYVEGVEILVRGGPGIKYFDEALYSTLVNKQPFNEHLAGMHSLRVKVRDAGEYWPGVEVPL